MYNGNLLKKGQKRNPYCFEINKTTIIDPFDKVTKKLMCATAYLNENLLNPELNNCYFKVTNGIVEIRALRDIKVHEELCIQYGESFWRGWYQRYPLELLVQVKNAYITKGHRKYDAWEEIINKKNAQLI